MQLGENSTPEIKWRKCDGCGLSLPLGSFALSPKGGRSNICRVCEDSLRGDFDKSTTAAEVDREQADYVPLDGLDIPLPQYDTKPSETEFDPAKAAAAILKRRELARRRLLPFIMEFKRGYSVGWVHKDITRRLEKFAAMVERGESPRLMLFMPPRSGKSEIVSRNFPAWFLGRNPEMEIIACSYAASLANSFSRKVREILRDPAFKHIFPECELDKENQAVEQWMTSEGGAYVSAGVGGSIVGKGAHCFPAGTPVTMADGSRVRIEDVIVGKDVLTHDEKSGIVTAGKVIAKQAMYNDSGLFEVRTATGKRVTATGNHPFYVTSLGWVRADELKEGYEVIVDKGGAEMPVLRQGDNGETFGYKKAYQEWADCSRMLTRLFRETPIETTPEMHDVWGAFVGQTREVLRHMQANGLHPSAEGYVSGVLEEFSALPQWAKILLRELCERESLAQHAGREESELSSWFSRQVSTIVSCDADYDSGEGLAHVRGLLRDIGFMCASHRPHADKQRAGEFDYDVQKLSHYAPQVERDRVSSVVRIGDAIDPVYDIQVEGTSCFFAGDILVHNCLIIDDPVKGRDEAQSENTKESIRDWYTGSAYTRLAPGGGVLIIMQRWAEDDLAGWLLEQDRLNEDEDTKENWEVVLYPAIAEVDEEYRNKGEALHPERYNEKALARIRRTVGERDWHALFQQNPLPETGDYFKEEHFIQVPRSEYPDVATMNVFAAWDLALTEKESNDPSVGFYVGVCPDKLLWVLHVERCWLTSKDLTDRIFELDAIWRPSLTGFEEGHIEKAIGPFFEAEMIRRRHFIPFEPLKVGRRDKQMRATTWRGMMQAKQVYWDRNDEAQLYAKAEYLKFPNGKHDDTVDAGAHMGMMCQHLVSKTIAKAPPKKGWREEFLKKMRVKGSDDGSFMSA